MTRTWLLGLLGWTAIGCADSSADGPDRDETTAALDASSSGSTRGGDDSTSAGDGGSGSSGANDDGGTTGEPMPTECEVPRGSPPSFETQGYRLVPIDAVELDVALSFDAASETTTGHAALRFRLGPEGGLPLFDLRQQILDVRLDGEPLAGGTQIVRPPGTAPELSMQVVNAELEPCSEHVLELDYAVVPPENSKFPRYSTAGVTWHTNLRDQIAGRYTEAWMPSNLPHDAVAVVIELEVVGTAAEHLVAANGVVEEIASSRWRVTLPPHHTSLSPLVALVPAATFERAVEDVTLPDGEVVTLEVVHQLYTDDQMADLLATGANALQTAALELGPYPHGDHFLVLATDEYSGMEYEGATRSDVATLHHEVFHSWIGRGLKPLRHRDGWIDETWTTYAIDHAYASLGPPSGVHTLAPDDPWARTTPSDAYIIGPDMLASFADVIGVDNLRGVLREFYGAHAGESVTTEELQAALADAIGNEIVDPAFDKYVYGKG